MFLYPVHLSISTYQKHCQPGAWAGRISRDDDPLSLPSMVADSDPTRSTARLISGAPVPSSQPCLLEGGCLPSHLGLSVFGLRRIGLMSRVMHRDQLSLIFGLSFL